jgi:hypothetical protein
MALAIRPPCVQERRINVDELHGWALQQVVPHLEGLRMLSSTVEKRHDFIEDVGGRDEARQRCHDPLPVLCGRLMMLVIGNFQRSERACVDKHRMHWL